MGISMPLKSSGAVNIVFEQSLGAEYSDTCFGTSSLFRFWFFSEPFSFARKCLNWLGDQSSSIIASNTEHTIHNGRDECGASWASVLFEHANCQIITRKVQD
jgi:hypothetical protein